MDIELANCCDCAQQNKREFW